MRMITFSNFFIQKRFRIIRSNNFSHCLEESTLTYSLNFRGLYTILAIPEERGEAYAFIIKELKSIVTVRISACLSSRSTVCGKPNVHFLLFVLAYDCR